MDSSQLMDANTLEWLSNMVMYWGIRVVGAIVVLVIGRMVAGWARRLITKALERSSTDATLTPFLAGAVYYLVLTFVGIAVLGLFGIPTASLIAVLGAVGLAVGLALQGTLSNFAAGVMLLLLRPINVGDYIDAGGVAGTVVSIGIFSTTLNTPDNVRIIAPNSAIFGQSIKNYSANDTRRVDLVVGVSYDDDLKLAMDTCRKVVEADERVLAEPKTTIAVSEMGASSMDLVVRPWCNKGDYWAVRFDLIERMKVQLEAAGCSIPFPQRDVHLYEKRSA